MLCEQWVGDCFQVRQYSSGLEWNRDAAGDGVEEARPAGAGDRDEAGLCRHRAQSDRTGRDDWPAGQRCRRLLQRMSADNEDFCTTR